MDVVVPGGDRLAPPHAPPAGRGGAAESADGSGDAVALTEAERALARAELRLAVATDAAA